MTPRQYLEWKALTAVCTPWHWELADTIDATPDEELQKIIDNPHIVHEEQGFDCEGNELEEVRA
jgi:hypothetical protein